MLHVLQRKLKNPRAVCISGAGRQGGLRTEAAKLESGVFGTRRSKQEEAFGAAVAEMLIIWST